MEKEESILMNCIIVLFSVLCLVLMLNILFVPTVQNYPTYNDLDEGKIINVLSGVNSNTQDKLNNLENSLLSNIDYLSRAKCTIKASEFVKGERAYAISTNAGVSAIVCNGDICNKQD